MNISGPNNVKNISPNKCAAFNSRLGIITPSDLGLLELAIEKNEYTLEQYEEIFTKEMTKFKLPEMKLMPETAWKKIKRHIRDILEDEDD